MAIDNKLIEDYLTSHHIQAQKTDWGVYIQVKDPGQGEKPTIGKYVNVRYSGKHMNGEVFDSGVFPLQIGTGAVVKGFEEGIKQLGTGGKATVYIPSMLAYGANGRDPKVKPNEVLIFDLELLQVSDKPIQPAPQPVDTSAARR
jgi:FKBP-type peptidyl-prolyl cis-trans isomerase